MIKKAFNSFLYAIRGLKTVWKEEQNFRIEVVIAVLVLFSIFYFNFTFVESVFCLIAILFVICGEIVNTVVEDICNKIEPNQNPIIGKIKDMMAGFVLVSSIGALLVGILVFYNHFLL